MVAWHERRLAAPDGVLLPTGLPSGWEGTNFEVYGLPTGPASTVSFAVRWHGARPAVLFEQSGTPVRLTAPVVAPEWSTADTTGDVLWPVPPGLTPDTDIDTGTASFS